MIHVILFPFLFELHYQKIETLMSYYFQKIHHRSWRQREYLEFYLFIRQRELEKIRHYEQYLA
jgi:hypothetical protein